MTKYTARWIGKVALLLLGGGLALNLIAYFTAEGLWFNHLGYLEVFQLQVAIRLGLWLLVLGVTGGIVGGNLLMAHRWKYGQSVQLPPQQANRKSLLKFLVILMTLSLVLVCLLTQMAQTTQQFWHPLIATVTPESQQLTQFTLQSMGRLLQQWVMLPWQLVVVGSGCLLLLLYPTLVTTVIAIGLSLGMGLIVSSHWATVLAFFNATPFNRPDPLFNNDIGFFVFVLPIWELVRFWFVGVSLTSGITVAMVYLLSGNSLAQGGFPGLSPLQQRHLNGLAAGLMLAIAWSFWLGRYNLLYSTQGILYGAGYTDVQVDLPVRTLLSLGALALSLWFLGRVVVWNKIPHRWVLSTLLALYALTAVLLGLFLPKLVQAIVVQPNELAREQPYLENSIRSTRAAFDLDNIETKTFNPTANLTPERLQANELTIRNIRVWDTRPYLEANRQLQRIRLYYEFPAANVDRYTLKVDPLTAASQTDERTTERRQVLIAAREIDYSAVPQEAQTWVNQRMIYTHGYGLTMSPVNTAASGGLPDYFIKDIGTGAKQGTLQTANPSIEASIPTGRPRIYFGEITNTYVMTDTKVPELDYPSGDENVYNTYAGEGGIAIGPFWKRNLFALYLKDWRMIFTQNFTPQTRVLFRRQIQERVEVLAPFLRFDRDPYLVAANATPDNPDSTNTLYWIIDAYTTSDRYPYSDPGPEPFNYIRNSVKVVVDAYNGSVTFYTVDANDPLLRTWRRIFPNLFQPLDAMPASLKSHIRYPVDLFKTQSQSLLIYHMTDPQVFYNREDQWRIPKEIYGDESQLVEPYYLTMRLPEADGEEFILLFPFTPIRRNNLIAWMAARSDGRNYGKRLLYEFPKQKLVFGPEQIEALINQDPVISQQISLWNRQGSRVIQGNLLIIPIDQSLLYVEPLYLEAEETSVPILARVIVVFEDRIVMAENLEQSLDGIFRSGTATESTIVRPLEEFTPGS